MYWPPDVWRQWTARVFFPARRDLAAAGLIATVVYCPTKPVSLAAGTPLIYTSASSSWKITSLAGAGTARRSNARRSQMSGVSHGVLTRAAGFLILPNPPGPLFHALSSKPGFSQPSAGLVVV